MPAGKSISVGFTQPADLNQRLPKGRAGLGNLDRTIGGISAWQRARCAERIRRDDEQTSTPEPHTGIQGEGGIGGDRWPEHGGWSGAALRRSSQPDHAMEVAASGRGCRGVRVCGGHCSQHAAGRCEVTPCQDRRADAGDTCCSRASSALLRASRSPLLGIGLSAGHDEAVVAILIERVAAVAAQARSSGLSFLRSSKRKAFFYP